MKKSLSKILNLSNMLYAVYQNNGKDSFIEELSKCFLFIINSQRDNPEDAYNRIRGIVTNILSNLLENDAEQVFRAQTEILERSFKEHIIEDKVKIILHEFDRFLDEFSQNKETLSEKIVSHVKNSSDKDLSRITVESLSDTFEFSTGYFAKTFKKEQKITLQDFILYEKLNRVFRILSDPDNTLPIHQVSESMGFYDLHYFRKLFKKKFGFPPSHISKTIHKN